MQARLSRKVMAVALTSVLGIGAAQGQTPQKNWKDRAEYDLFESINKETNGARKLDLLNNWKDKYANTDFKQERLTMFLTTYQALNQPAKMIETAREMLSNDPKEFQALYWITFLTPSMNNPAPDALGSGEQAAGELLANLDATFAPEKKPANLSEADWKKARQDMEALGHKTLGWVAMLRKNNDAAEKEFVKSMEINQNAGEVSYWLGTVILAQKKPERQSEVLFHFGRAANYDGPGALPPEGRKQIDAYFVKAYNNYHGQDDAGLKELRALARSKPVPPADFKIKSSNEISAESEEAFKQSNPQLALWMGVKKELTTPTGEQYFESTLKGAGVPKLKGKLISHKPVRAPKELVLGIADPKVAEVTLKLDAALPGRADAGTELEFEGIAVAYAKEPFMVTFEVEKEKLSGWPTQGAPPAKKPAAKKAGGVKKT